MNTKEQSYKKLEQLIDKFTTNYDDYKNQNYNETKTRIDFINPFFEAFNWDMNNKNNLRESSREVVHEASISVRESKNIKRTKSPDYLFRQNAKGIFFVEAKKPFVNIKEDIDPAYQLRRTCCGLSSPLKYFRIINMITINIIKKIDLKCILKYT